MIALVTQSLVWLYPFSFGPHS